MLAALNAGRAILGFLLVNMITACGSMDFNGENCAQVSGEIEISSVYNTKWENRNGAIFIVPKSSDLQNNHGGYIYSYTCTATSCQRSPGSEEFDYYPNSDSTKWIENTLVMPARWVITLATGSKLAYQKPNYNGDCATVFEKSGKPFLEE